MPLYFFAFSGLLNGITSAALGLYVYSQDPRNKLYQTYGIFCIACSLWSFPYFFWLISGSELSAVFFSRLLMVGAIFIPSANLHYFLRLLDNYEQKKHLLFISYGASIFFFLVALTPYFVRGVSPRSIFPYWPEPGFLFHPYLVFFIASVIHLFFVLVSAYSQASGLRRNQLKYLIFALIFGYGGGATNFPLWYGLELLPYGTVGGSIYIFLVTYAIVRYRLMDINVVIKKSLVYALLLLTLMIPCYLLVIWMQLAFFGTVSFAFSLITLLLLILVAFLFPKLRFRTEEAFERVLFKKRNDYRTALIGSSRDLVSMVDLQAISNSTVQTIGKAMGVEKASLFLADDINGSFALKASVGLIPEPFQGPLLLGDDPLVRRLMERPEAMVKEELEMARTQFGEKHLAERMGQLEAEVALPLMSKERLIGILNLGHKEGREMYSHEDLEVLSTLANQAAIAIENARLYENLKQSQSIIRRADRLSSLGMLTAGLAHEIRNPLVAIRTFTQLLPERYQDVEFRNSFQALALKEVDRICGLINDLLSFARPSPPNVSAENINEIVESIVRILESEAKEKEVHMSRHLAPDLPKIFIDKEQIKQVSMNVILNALQSIEGRGVVAVSTRLFTKNGSAQYVQIEVRDSGVGIPDKDLEDIFNPFFTTKKDGSGLGLSISHQIVQEHGGYIVVESQVGKGTTFFINLPVRQPDHQEAKDRLQVHEEDFGR